jgi:predicted hotdog family 3-hydroxylacyl-ACP dehydratase
MTQEAIGLPPISELVVHRAPMLLLERVLEHAPEETSCVATVERGSLFLEADGTVPSWVALEYMAQCIAAHAGLRARQAGDPPPRGFLVGSRRTELHTTGFTPGQMLIVTARRVWGDRESGAFACQVRDAATGMVVAQGALTVFAPATPELQVNI